VSVSLLSVFASTLPLKLLFSNKLLLLMVWKFLKS